MRAGSRRVPPGPILGAVMMSGLAVTLIGVIIARSPYTHANLSPRGYDRTEIVYVGDEHAFEGLGLADPRRATTGDPVADGRALFFQYGCAACHGLKGQGGAVGKEIADAEPAKIVRRVRSGPKTMPEFSTSEVSEADLEKLIKYLESTGRTQ